MINLQNVMDILENLISERLTISSTSTNGLKDEKVATIVFENIQFTLNGTSNSFENEDTLDYDFNIELTEDDSHFENNEDDDENSDDDCNRNDDSRDTDNNDECKNENIVRYQFSLGHMKSVVQFYDERNSKGSIRKDKLRFLLYNS